MRKTHSSLIETLEARAMLSTSVVLSGSTLFIFGDAAAQTVEIQDGWTARSHRTIVWVDANGDGTFADPDDLNARAFDGVTNFDIRLDRGADRLRINLADPYSGAGKRFNIDTGNGNDSVTFANAIGNNVVMSSVDLAISTGGGADSVLLEVGEFSNASLNAMIATGDRSDNVTVNANGSVSASQLKIRADLGAGDDRATTRLDWDMFDVLGSLSTFRSDLFGGDGNDQLTARGELGNSAAVVQGTLDLGLIGQGGDDVLSSSLDTFHLDGGLFRLRTSGGPGKDQVSLADDFGASSAGKLLQIAFSARTSNHA